MQWLSFFQDAYVSFGEKDAVDKIVIIATLLFPFMLSVLGWGIGLRTWRYHKRRLEQELVVAQKNVERANKDRDLANDALAVWRPADWLAVFEREKSQGNYDSGIRKLNIGFENVRTDLSNVVGLLADYSAGLIEDEHSGTHEPALRFARLASLLDADNKDAATLLDELAFLYPETTPNAGKIALPDFILPSTPAEAAARINANLTYRNKLFDKGLYRSCLLIDKRNVQIVSRMSMLDEPIGLIARYYECQSLDFSGFSNAALEKIKALLPVEEQVRGTEHPSVLTTRYLEAQLLNATGDPQTALEKVKALLPVRERVQGAEHPHVLMTHYLEAQLLDATGDPQTALEKIDALLPVMKRVQGAEYPDVLTTRYLEARLLDATGDPQTALEKIKALLPIRERVQGAEHPSVLSTRHLEAQLLNATGDPQTALEKVQALLPVREWVQGAEHPHVLMTRYLEALLLNATGDPQTALEKIKALLPVEEQVRGTEHPHVLRTYWLRAKILSKLDRVMEALDELKRILPLQVLIRTNKHKHIRETQALIEELEQRGLASVD